MSEVSEQNTDEVASTVHMEYKALVTDISSAVITEAGDTMESSLELSTVYGDISLNDQAPMLMDSAGQDEAASLNDSVSQGSNSQFLPPGQMLSTLNYTSTRMSSLWHQENFTGDVEMSIAINKEAQLKQTQNLFDDVKTLSYESATKEADLGDELVNQPEIGEPGHNSDSSLVQQPDFHNIVALTPDLVSHVLPVDELVRLQTPIENHGRITITFQQDSVILTGEEPFLKCPTTKATCWPEEIDHSSNINLNQMDTGEQTAISDENLNLKVTRLRSVLPPDGSITKLYDANVPVSKNDLLLGADFMSFKSFPDLCREKFMIDKEENKAVESATCPTSTPVMYDLNLADSDILVDVSHQTHACTQGFQYDRKGCGEEIMVEQGELKATDSLKTPPGTRNMCKLNLIEPDTSLDECSSLQAQDVTPVQWSNLQYDRGRGRDIGHSVAHKDYYQASSKDRYHWRGSIFHKLRDHPQGSHNFTAGSNVHDLEDWCPESYDHGSEGNSIRPEFLDHRKDEYNYGRRYRLPTFDRDHLDVPTRSDSKENTRSRDHPYSTREGQEEPTSPDRSSLGSLDKCSSNVEHQGSVTTEYKDINNTKQVKFETGGSNLVFKEAESKPHGYNRVPSPAEIEPGGHDLAPNQADNIQIDPGGGTNQPKVSTSTAGGRSSVPFTRDNHQTTGISHLSGHLTSCSDPGREIKDEIPIPPSRNQTHKLIKHASENRSKKPPDVKADMEKGCMAKCGPRMEDELSCGLGHNADIVGHLTIIKLDVQMENDFQKEHLAGLASCISDSGLSCQKDEKVKFKEEELGSLDSDAFWFVKWNSVSPT